MIEDDPSGSRARPRRALRVRRSTSSAGPVIGTRRHGARAHEHATSRPTTASRYGAGNVVVAAAGNVEHEWFRALVAEQAASSAPPRRAVRSTPAPAGGQQLFLARDTEQYHVCLSAPGLRRDDERRFALGAARPRAGRCCLLAARAGDPRAARHGLQRLQLHGQLRRRRPDRHLRRHARRERGGVRRDRARADGPTSPRAAWGPTRPSAPRRASRGACCCRWNRRRRACPGSGAPC